MYHIAIVEDEKEFRDQLQEFLKQYEAENQISFQISVFEDGTEILENYKNEYDIILLDIEMPKLNGMDAAEQIREKDEDVVLMFITNMAQYAIHGYSVGALDFVILYLFDENDKSTEAGAEESAKATRLNFAGWNQDSGD